MARQRCPQRTAAMNWPNGGGGGKQGQSPKRGLIDNFSNSVQICNDHRYSKRAKRRGLRHRASVTEALICDHFGGVQDSVTMLACSDGTTFAGSLGSLLSPSPICFHRTIKTAWRMHEPYNRIFHQEDANYSNTFVVKQFVASVHLFVKRWWASYPIWHPL